MELSELLGADRVRCHCTIQSKKRTLQTLAELLAASLKEEAERMSAATEASPEGDAAKARRVPGKKSGIRLMRKSEKQTKAERSSDGDKAEQNEALSDRTILDALNSRERLGSTALGHGVALPHSRMAGIDAPMAALLTLADGVDFQSDDGEPVDLVVGLLVPENCNDEHLQILASLAKRFSDADLRKRLREFEDGTALLSHLQSLVAEDNGAST